MEFDILAEELLYGDSSAGHFTDVSAKAACLVPLHALSFDRR